MVTVIEGLLTPSCFGQTLTSVSRLRVRSAQHVWTRLTATAACVHPGEPERGVRKVNTFHFTQFTAALVHNSASLCDPSGHMTCVGFRKRTSLHGQRPDHSRWGEMGQGL